MPTRATLPAKFRREFAAILEPAGAPPERTITARGSILARCVPETVDQVSAVMAACQQYSIPVHPVSGGANWGFGASVPWSTEAALMLDLRRLDRILECDPRWGVIRVQAGVRFEAAWAHIQAHAPKFVLNTIGGSPQASVLANAVERGHGVGDYNDRFGALRRMRVVLPDGSQVTTDLPTEQPARTHRWGNGPSLRGLFSQSNLGIVVEADMLLAPKPRYWETFTAWFFDPTRAGEAVERAREARTALRMVVYTAHRGWNDAGRKRPFRTTKVGYPIRICFHYWAADADELRAKRKHAEKISRGLGATRLVESNWSRIRTRSLSEMPADVALRTHDEEHADAPSESSVRAMYRIQETTPAPSPINLDASRVGLLWSTPIVPMEGDAFHRVVDAAESIALRNRVEPDIVFINLDDWRYLDGIVGFLFDANRADGLECAQAAFQEFDAFCREHEYSSYRTGIQHRAADVLSGERLDFIRRLRREVDPAGILSPWRTSPE